MNTCANNYRICQAVDFFQGRAVDLKVMGVQYSTEWMGSPR